MCPQSFWENKLKKKGNGRLKGRKRWRQRGLSVNPHTFAFHQLLHAEAMVACAGSSLSDTSDSFLLILPKPLFIQQHAHILFIPLFNFIFIYCGALSRARIIKCLPRFDHMVTAASGRVRVIQKQAKLNLKTILFTGLLEFIKQHIARAHAQILTHRRAHTSAIYSDRAKCHLSIIRIHVSSFSFPTDSWRKCILQINKLRVEHCECTSCKTSQNEGSKQNKK